MPQVSLLNHLGDVLQVIGGADLRHQLRDLEEPNYASSDVNVSL
ncbi:hypothetical protein [Mycobacterium persicum]|nr:hypothetical protein [Mycobacterium persicum]